MHIVHIALGGCLTAPPIRYGITADTGGHIAYLLGAAFAQARRPEVAKLSLVTRAFSEPTLAPSHALADEPLSEKVTIRRIRGGGDAYLEKEDLLAALPELEASFLAALEGAPRPDVIHAHFSDAAQLALAARERYGIPVVYTPHSLALGKRECGLDSPQLTQRIERERRAIAEADAVIVSSRDEAERQLRDYDAEAAGRTYRVSPGVYLAADDGATTSDAERLLAPFLRHPQRPLLLAIARPVAKKNLQAVLAAYAKTPGLRDVANLAIVAGLRDSPADGGPEQRAIVRDLLDGVDAHDLYGHVALPKRHRPEDIPQLYRHAAATGGAFVNPALHEPFGLTFLEAAAHGLPVVATDCGGPSDILPDIGHGTLVDPSDTEAIGRAMLRTITDAPFRQTLAEALAGGLGDYSWDAYAARATGIYAKLAAQARTAHPNSSRPQLSNFSLSNPPTFLLVSDMDGTLTGSRGGVVRFRKTLRDNDLAFVLSTGRSLPEARRIMYRWDLPEPDAFVTAVGTEIHFADTSGRMRLDSDYAAHIGRAWVRDGLLATLGNAGVTFQRDVEQRDWKLSLYGDAAEAARVRTLLAEAGHEITVTYSHGRFIDVTPGGVDKACAMRWIAQRFGRTTAECIACGDSGNDEAMLRAAGQAVVVANALPELDGLRGPRVLRTRAPYAQGVVEALERLGAVHASERPLPSPKAIGIKVTGTSVARPSLADDIALAA